MSENTFTKTLVKQVSIKPSKDSLVSKTVTLKISFNAFTVDELFELAAKPIIIRWQNSHRGKKYDDITDKGVYSVDAKHPTAGIDPTAAMAARLAAMNESERRAELTKLAKLAGLAVAEVNNDDNNNNE